MVIKELKAREGYYLTQTAAVENRVFITAIKGANINEYEWREASEEEKEQYELLKERESGEINKLEE